jgi:hypothetical protein
LTTFAAWKMRRFGDRAHSLFEEQLALESKALDDDLSRGTESFAESLGYLPDLEATTA